MVKRLKTKQKDVRGEQDKICALDDNIFFDIMLHVNDNVLWIVAQTCREFCRLAYAYGKASDIGHFRSKILVMALDHKVIETRIRLLNGLGQSMTEIVLNDTFDAPVGQLPTTVTNLTYIRTEV